MPAAAPGAWCASRYSATRLPKRMGKYVRGTSAGHAPASAPVAERLRSAANDAALR